jgi:hypothetical protein
MAVPMLDRQRQHSKIQLVHWTSRFGRQIKHLVGKAVNALFSRDFKAPADVVTRLAEVPMTKCPWRH